MDDEDYQEPHADAGDDPAAAFERLRGEVALLRHAVEGLASARASIEIPDYQPTLERTEKVLGVLAQQVEGVRKSSVMTLTPETLGQRVNASVTSATNELRNSVSSAKSALDGATRDLSGLVVSARRGETGAPESWMLIVAASPLSDSNRETVQACRERAAKAKKPVRCTIEVKPAVAQ